MVLYQRIVGNIYHIIPYHTIPYHTIQALEDARNVVNESQSQAVHDPSSPNLYHKPTQSLRKQNITKVSVVEDYVVTVVSIGECMPTKLNCNTGASLNFSIC